MPRSPFRPDRSFLVNLWSGGICGASLFLHLAPSGGLDSSMNR